MPYRLDWFEAPKDESLLVLQELPEGVVETTRFSGPPEARGVVEGEYRVYHHCRHCEGWIEGEPNTYRENTHAPHALAGRKGTVYHCRRCGQEIAFSGIVS